MAGGFGAAGPATGSAAGGVSCLRGLVGRGVFVTATGAMGRLVAMVAGGGGVESGGSGTGDGGISDGGTAGAAGPEAASTGGAGAASSTSGAGGRMSSHHAGKAMCSNQDASTTQPRMRADHILGQRPSLPGRSGRPTQSGPGGSIRMPRRGGSGMASAMIFPDRGTSGGVSYW